MKQPTHLKKDYAVKFWSKVRKGEGCWLWQGRNAAGSTPAFRSEGGMVKANRYAYAYFNGPLPSGIMLMRTGCENVLCVNPAHYTAGDRATLAASNRQGGNKPNDDECRNGHPRTEGNTITNNDGSRRCRLCSQMAGQRYVSKRRVGALPPIDYAAPAARLLTQIRQARNERAEWDNSYRTGVYFRPATGQFLFDDKALPTPLVDYLFGAGLLVYEKAAMHQGESMLFYGPPEA